MHTRSRSRWRLGYREYRIIGWALGIGIGIVFGALVILALHLTGCPAC